MTLEELLQTYFGCEGDAFDENDNMTESGENAYYELCNCLGDLAVLGIIPSQDAAERVLDDIINHSY